jgi:hypothetical protein
MPRPSLRAATCLSLLAAAGPASAAVHKVGPVDGGDLPGIAEIIAAADPSEPLELELSPGRYAPLQIDAGRQITLRAIQSDDPGAWPVLEQVQLAHPDARVHIESVVFSGAARALTITEGELSLSAVALIGDPATGVDTAVLVEAGGKLRAERVFTSGWRAIDGVWRLEPGANAAIEASAFVDCGAEHGGAILQRGGLLSLTDVQARGTAADEDGGAISITGGAALIDGLVVTDSVALRGGAVSVQGGTVHIEDARLRGNEAQMGGHVAAVGGSLHATRVIFDRGVGHQGGALYVADAGAYLDNALFIDNAAIASGGAVHQEGGGLTLRYANLHGNIAELGGGIAISSGEAWLGGLIFTDTLGEALINAGGTAVELVASFIRGTAGELPVAGGVTWLPEEALLDPRLRDPGARDFLPLTNSPALDLVSLGQIDHDGTWADAGMYGGPEAWVRADADGDGFVEGRDCDDGEAATHEAAIDALYDGVDQDCDGWSDYDQDRDGHDAAEFGGEDCDDRDPRVHPGAWEAGVDDVDDDCDGEDAPDRDGDGWVRTLDCDDTDPLVFPGQKERWYDDIDQNCDYESDWDRDGDGYDTVANGGLDCDDNNPFVHPLSVDVADDGVDQDCDGMDAVAEPEGAASTDTGIAGVRVGPEQAPAPGPRISAAVTTGGCATGGAALGFGLWPLVAAALGARRRR